MLCFDGDAAGRKAAFRAVETVMPLLRPGFSVRFAFLPGGLDPDDLVRQQGPDAFAAELGTYARPVRRAVAARGAGAGSLDTRAARRLRDAPQGHGRQDRGCDGQGRTTSASCARRCGRSTARWCARSPAAKGQRRTGPGGARRNNVTPDWRVRERARLTHGGQQPSAQAHRQATASTELSQRAELVPPRRGPDPLYPSEPSLAHRGPFRGDCGANPVPRTRPPGCGMPSYRCMRWKIHLTAPLYAPN